MVNFPTVVQLLYDNLGLRCFRHVNFILFLLLSFMTYSFCSLHQVIEISEYRTQLYEYLQNRMMAIAPNVTVMVGELVGARLIAHAGDDFNVICKHGY